VRLGLIADIHGNLPALDAVLAELGREGVDRVVCLGDISIGPQPVETLERVRSLDCPMILGNWDAWLVEGMPELANGHLGEVLGDLCSWAGERLSSEQRDLLLGFAPALELDLPDGEQLLAFHGSPRSFEDAIFATTPDDELEEMLDGRQALVHVAPWAEYGLLGFEDGRVSIELRRAPFDLDALLTALRESGMPHAEWWAARWTSRSPAVS
jgi:hypothetical protein